MAQNYPKGYDFEIVSYLFVMLPTKMTILFIYNNVNSSERSTYK